MAKKKNSKKKCQTFHARRRAEQRFGIQLNIDEAVKAIQNGNAKLIERQSLRVTVWLVEQDGKKFPVVYDKQRQSIATVLPKEYLISFGIKVD